MSEGINVGTVGGLVLVRATDKAEQEHRWWFDETEAGRLLFGSEIIGYDEGRRHYVPEDEMEVPDRVRDELEAEGYETILDTEGRPL